MELSSPVDSLSGNIYSDLNEDIIMRGDYFDDSHTFMNFDDEPYTTATYRYSTHDVLDIDTPDSPLSDEPDSISVTSSTSYDLPQTPQTPSLEKQNSVEDYYPKEHQNADIHRMNSLWSNYEIFSDAREWTIEEKAMKVLRLSPCNKYTVTDLINVNQIEDPTKRIHLLTEVVAGIKMEFRWNIVKPHELFKCYTVVANCKKTRPKLDEYGNPKPKRPMNAFMIWCQKNRTLMAHFSSQLHNAIISKVLGVFWAKVSKEDREFYENEKKKLMAFHRAEFPDYKYRPKKKAKKTASKPEESQPTPPSPPKKSKSKKKTTEKSQQLHISNGVVTDVTQQSVHPVVRERLQVKIDPDFKRGMGKRSTAIDITDLPGYQLSQISPAVSPNNIENSSVFDSPKSSPRTPSPKTIEQKPSLNVTLATAAPGSVIFKFDSSSIYKLPLENNNNLPFLIPGSVMTIKKEPGTLSNSYWNTQLVKPEIMAAPVSPVADDLPMCEPPVLDSDWVQRFLLEANEEISKSEMNVYLNEPEPMSDNMFIPVQSSSGFWNSAINIKTEDTGIELQI